MKKFTVILFATSLFMPFNANGFDKTNSTSIIGIESKIDTLVKQYQDIDIFSGVVLIADNGNPIYHKAYGLADREKNIKNSLNTKFDIGSMNKTFTKVAVLQLVEEGKLKLDDKLSKLLPQFSNKVFSKITINHLINHSSGFGDYYMSEGFFDLPASEKSIAALVKRISKMPLLFEAGEEREYSNSGYILLGAIIENVSGETYHNYIKEKIVDPLELKETYITDKYNVPDRAIGYYKNMKGELIDNNTFGEVANPDGGFHSTALDIMKFYREYHYGDNILKKDTKLKDEFFSLIQQHATSGGAIPHAGGFNGANSSILEVLRDGITIVVMANMNEPVAEQLSKGILDIIREQEPQKPSLPAIENVYKAYNENGVNYVKDNFNNLTRNFHPTDPKALILNQIGYEFLFENQIDKAIEIFKLNTNLFGHEDPNVWDSLGEAYLNKGEKEEALMNYKKALEMDPNLPSAIQAIDDLSK